MFIFQDYDDIIKVRRLDLVEGYRKIFFHVIFSVFNRVCNRESIFGLFI